MKKTNFGPSIRSDVSELLVEHLGLSDEKQKKHGLQLRLPIISANLILDDQQDILSMKESEMCEEFTTTRSTLWRNIDKPVKPNIVMAGARHIHDFHLVPRHLHMLEASLEIMNDDESCRGNRIENWTKKYFEIADPSAAIAVSETLRRASNDTVSLADELVAREVKLIQNGLNIITGRQAVPILQDRAESVLKLVQLANEDQSEVLALTQHIPSVLESIIAASDKRANHQKAVS